MTPEQGLYRYLKKGMKGRWHVQRHEDLYCSGIPDISFGIKGCQGWIELKVLPKWPVKETTIVKIRHFTETQKAWLLNRGCHGGRCYMLLKISSSREYLLFDYVQVKIHMDKRTKDELIEGCSAYYKNNIDFDSLALILEGGY